LRPLPKREISFNRKTGAAYSSKTVKWYQRLLSFYAKRYLKESNKKMIEGPIILCVTFFIKRPKKPKYNLPMVKPDSSNMLKPLEDALQGIFFENDKDIVFHVLQKVYAEEDSVKVICLPYSENFFDSIFKYVSK